MLEQLGYYLSFPFVRYAMVVAVLISLCSAIFGVILVLKRFSFIGDGLSHAAFGALAVAAILNVSNDMIIILPFTVILAILLLKAPQNSKIKGDAAVAMISVGSLAVGYLLLNIFSASTNVAGDVCSSLFGATSILTLTAFDMWLCIALTVAVLLLFILCYNRIFSVTFDEAFASATGTSAEKYNTVVAIITAVIIVLAMKLVGSLLISALIIFPAITSMRVCKSFRSVVVCAAVLGVFCAVVGVLASVLGSLPVGPSIVAVNIVCFVIFSIIGKLK